MLLAHLVLIVKVELVVPKWFENAVRSDGLVGSFRGLGPSFYILLGSR